MHFFSWTKAYKSYGPKNLKLIFPNKPEDKINAIRDSSAYQIFDAFCTLHAVSSLKREDIRPRINKIDSITSEVCEIIKNYFITKNRGVVFVGVHHHHWLLGPILLSTLFDVKICLIAKRHGYSKLDEWLPKKLSSFTHWNSESKIIIPQDENDKSLLVKLSKFLTTPGIVILAADLATSKQTKIVNFFGVPTDYGLGPFNLALIKKTPVFFASCKRVEKNYDVICRPIITDFPKLDNRKSKDALLDHMIKKYVKYQEAEILKDPGGSIIWVSEDRWRKKTTKLS